MSRDKVVADAADAVADVGRGASLAVGGFGLCGIPGVLIHALLERGSGELRVVSNNCGVDELGPGAPAAGGADRSDDQFLRRGEQGVRAPVPPGELEVELVPQGTLAERLRAGGSGIPAFYTPAGAGTVIAEGGLAWRHGADGSVAVASPPRETRLFGGREHLLEEGITTDFALVRAAVGDQARKPALRLLRPQLQPLAAMARRITVAEVEELVEPGELAPDDVHLPGIFVQRVVPIGADDPRAEKRIERLTVRTAPAVHEGTG